MHVPKTRRAGINNRFWKTHYLSYIVHVLSDFYLETNSNISSLFGDVAQELKMDEIIC